MELPIGFPCLLHRPSQQVGYPGRQLNSYWQQGDPNRFGASPPSAFGPDSWLIHRPDRLDGVQARGGGSGHGLVTAF